MLKAKGGATVSTIVHVVIGSKQSLLGLKDGQALGIISITPEGKQQVRQLSSIMKEKMPCTGEVLQENELYGLEGEDDDWEIIVN